MEQDKSKKCNQHQGRQFLSEPLLFLIFTLIFIFTPDIYIGSKYRLSVYLVCNNRYRHRPWKRHIGRPLVQTLRLLSLPTERCFRVSYLVSRSVFVRLRCVYICFKARIQSWVSARRRQNHIFRVKLRARRRAAGPRSAPEAYNIIDPHYCISPTAEAPQAAREEAEEE